MTHKRKRTIDPNGKRDAILQAGEMLFAQQGYANTSIADIAAKAGVAVGTVYRLFPDKATLLATLHKGIEDRFIDAMLRGWRSQNNFEDRFEPMIDALMSEASKMQKIMPLYALTRDIIGTTDYIPGKHTVEVISQMYEQGVKAKVYRDAESTIVAAIAHGMVDGAIRAWMNKPTISNQQEISATLKLLFKHSFIVHPVSE